MLNTARVNGAWNEIPEYVRKVTKHASSQSLLIQTATAEHYIATRTSQRPQTAVKDATSPLTTLKGFVEEAQNGLAEEVFQARSCLIWVSNSGAIEAPPISTDITDLVPTFDRYGQKATSTMTKICLLRTAYFQGEDQTNADNPLQAQVIWRAATAWIELNLDLVRSIPQLSYWAEQILAASGTIESKDDTQFKSLDLWSSLTSRSQESAPSTYGNVKSHISRTFVWNAYYKLLSSTLKQGSTTLPSQLANQIRRAETAYETAFLKNKKFPKASESNALVEEWVEQVIQNWQILCGPYWSEEDLGEGGRNALTRNVLDILYRAATKTFHSLLILRRLFQVHKSLTEFDLAYKCLDTYIELAETSRQRAQKAREQSPESDEIMLLAVSEGVEGLCSYGRLKEARKASELADKLEDWLDEIEEKDEHQTHGHKTGDHQCYNVTRLSKEALQTVYRAVGIARAHWGRWTPFTESRTDLQADATTALLKAVNYGDAYPSTLYALALVYAETRQMSEALKLAKTGLQKLSGDPYAPIDQQSAFWHLLTLLLSAQQEFETGLQTCSASIDSIMSTSTATATSNGLNAVANLECDSLQRVLELQTTHLAFVELIDGPEAALNHSDELLTLYWRLFKKYEVGDIKQATEQNLIPPKTSAGTIHSMRGSIFSRRKHTPSIVPSATTASLVSNSIAENGTRPVTQASEAPTIQVTDETGKSPIRKHHSLLHHRHHDKDSRRKSISKERPQTANTIKISNLQTTQDYSSVNSALNTTPTIASEHDQSSETKQDFSIVPHNVTSHEKAPTPLQHDEQPPQQDVRLPTIHPSSNSTSPIPRFPQSQAQRHALIILHKIWLIVATLYQRAHIFEDAREALEEATKTARRIEHSITSNDSSSRALADPAWGGGGKSADEIWADTYNARASLQHAIAVHRAETDSNYKISSEILRDIVDEYEQCLMFFPNHSAGIIGLSNILLDYYEQKIDLAKRVDDGRTGLTTTPKPETFPITPQDSLIDPFSKATINSDLRKTPENLNRIAARDRAYGLLNILTKLGTGWDNSEAWFALARAHELGGEIDKAKKILWYCIELEDTRPIRHWRNLGNGYVL